MFENYLLPVMPNHTKSILDYDVQIRNLRPEATYFVPAETGRDFQQSKVAARFMAHWESGGFEGYQIL